MHAGRRRARTRSASLTAVGVDSAQLYIDVAQRIVRCTAQGSREAVVDVLPILEGDIRLHDEGEARGGHDNQQEDEETEEVKKGLSPPARP